MSRRDSDVARLRRMRRMAQRRGLSILKATHPRSPESGYMLSVEEGRQVLLGDKPQPYSASLDAIEAYLDALPDEEG